MLADVNVEKLNTNKLYSLYSKADSDELKYRIYQEAYKRILPYFHKQYNKICQEYENYLNSKIKNNMNLYILLQNTGLLNPFDKNQCLDDLSIAVLECLNMNKIEEYSNLLSVIRRKVEFMLNSKLKYYCDKLDYIMHNYGCNVYIIDDNECGLKTELKKSMKYLKEREKEIVKMRYGLDGYEPMTLNEIGKIYNLSRDRIRQIEAKALRRLRNQVISKNLKDYYNYD